MRAKIPIEEQRQKVTVSISLQSKKMLYKVAKEMNMTASRFIEFLLMSMVKQDQMSFAEYITDLFKDIMNVKKPK